jgi:hypothetical protein
VNPASRTDSLLVGHKARVSRASKLACREGEVVRSGVLDAQNVRSILTRIAGEDFVDKCTRVDGNRFLLLS